MCGTKKWFPLPWGRRGTILGWWVGGVLLSHTRGGAVPSALEGLASGFGMGPGMSRSAVATDPKPLGGFVVVRMKLVSRLPGRAGWV